MIKFFVCFLLFVLNIFLTFYQIKYIILVKFMCKILHKKELIKWTSNKKKTAKN